jgi:hypothetical protein
MLPSIPVEASYALWLQNCIQRYFEALGFRFYSEVQSQQLEKTYPFDIYAEISKGNAVKRFGLQVKRPYTNKQGIYWNLSSNQHTQMQKFQWICYSLPDFLQRSYSRVACYHTLFKDPNFPFVSQLSKPSIGFYYRFGSFANALMSCSMGQIVDRSFDWVNSINILQQSHFMNQFHTYLDLTAKKGQIFTNALVERNREE